MEGVCCTQRGCCFTDGSSSVAPALAAAERRVSFSACRDSILAFNIAITDSVVLLSFFVAWRRALLGAAPRLLLCAFGGRVVTAGTMGRGILAAASEERERMGERTGLAYKAHRFVRVIFSRFFNTVSRQSADLINISRGHARAVYIEL